MLMLLTSCNTAPHVTLPQNGLGSKTDDGRAMDGREDDVRRTG
jgi:hypothetical protein